jgi:hypothetical protein
MKRRDFLRHLAAQSCELLREGGRHAIYFNPRTNATSSCPAIPKSMTFLLERFAATSASPDQAEIRMGSRSLLVTRAQFADFLFSISFAR